MYIIPIIICVVLVALDQITKWFVLKMLVPVGSVTIIDGFFNLTYVENRGAAFGFLSGAKWLFVLIALIVLIAGCFYYKKIAMDKDKLWLKVSMVMIASGAVGNVIDRLLRGYVVDFLDFIIFGYNFPVFNVADILVVLGTMLFAGGIIVFGEGEKE